MLQSNLYNVQRIGRRKRRVILSGKKKAHTVKTEILMEKVSKSYAGSTHDFRIKKQEKFLPKNSIKYADSGYQGWQELQSKLVIPYKRYRKKPLTPEQ
ncbi:hypothetical protein BIY23_02985 [Wolbachia pipientis]|uniref:DDE Tnp4 domain-containing protein n=1 Tax=Wolbachia pipientis TaxID=955 RepID=A0A1E7QJJ4_WOLPI|nr:hypothetical protein BIY23_02985 [Wolbachia pipientis]